jgi:Family of unknown function (DUF6282)
VHLSWDLHVHPGPVDEGRWGDGEAVWSAAKEAGVAGFVWKSHAALVADACRALPPDPRAIASVALNAHVDAAAVTAELEAGARWVWGPTRAGDEHWDLALPAWWPDTAARLEVGVRVVLATGHLGAEGRSRMAGHAAEAGAVCSVTHAAYLEDDELVALRDAGCVFEVDLYTAVFAQPSRPPFVLAGRLERMADLGLFVYLTSDGGQSHTGNPFDFAACHLDQLAAEVGPADVEEWAGANPERIVAWLDGGDRP